MEKVMLEDAVLSMVKDVELEFWADEKERELYFQHQQLLMDAYSDEHTYEVLLKQETEKAAKQGLEQGLKQGLEQGLKQGLDRGKREMADKLLKIGVDIESIVQASGLSEKEILGSS
jgi:predicted transposase/invertase (TIGR01784 family)